MNTLKSVAVLVMFGSTAFAIQAATVHNVTVGPGGDEIFAPAVITVELGDTVRWTWADDGHNVASGPPGIVDGAFLSGPPADEGTVFEVVFDHALLDAHPRPDNVYDYHCVPHAFDGMVGSVTVKAPEPCPWDLNDDSNVGPADLAILLGQWGPCADCAADFDSDGAVGPADLAAILGTWGPC